MTVGGRRGPGVGLPGERHYPFRTTPGGDAGHNALWSNAAMTGPGETRTLPPPGPSRPGRDERPRGLSGTIWVLEHAQDYVAAVVGVVLIVLAAVLIVSGLAGFVHSLAINNGLASKNILLAATGLLDRLLLVLIVAEIVHTVVLSLRAHRLVAQPFIVVGLVAVIRKILLVLSNETSTVNTTQLWLLIAMVVAFVAGLIAVSRFEKKEE
jgi:uncharacterized membrane protein (DUF373 family)